MNKTLAALVAAALTPVAPARADAPLVSETADVIESGRCQVEAAHARARARGASSISTDDLLLSCGLVASTQVAAGVTRERADGASEQAARAAGKTTLVAPSAGHAGYGVRYGIGWHKPSGEGWATERFELLGLYTRELAGGVLLHANLGHAHSRSARQGSTLWSLGVETVGTLTFAADTFGDDRSRPAVSGGLGYDFGGGFSANAGVAVQFEQPRVRSLTVGAKFVF